MKKKITRCIAPTVGKELITYYNGLLDESKSRKFLAHLKDCNKCKNTLRKLDWIAKTMSEKPDDFFSREVLGSTKLIQREKPGASISFASGIIVHHRVMAALKASKKAQERAYDEQAQHGAHLIIQYTKPRVSTAEVERQVKATHTANRLMNQGNMGNTLPKNNMGNTLPKK